MADIELVIKIPEKTYEQLKFLNEQGFGTVIDELVVNGIPLPKGHGKLIDADTIPMYRIRGVTEYDRGYNDRTTEIESDIENALIIIEADKGEWNNE